MLFASYTQKHSLFEICPWKRFCSGNSKSCRHHVIAAHVSTWSLLIFAPLQFLWTGSGHRFLLKVISLQRVSLFCYGSAAPEGVRTRGWPAGVRMCCGSPIISDSAPRPSLCGFRKRVCGDSCSCRVKALRPLCLGLTKEVKPKLGQIRLQEHFQHPALSKRTPSRRSPHSRAGRLWGLPMVLIFSC